ncbi:MAG TPA: TIGR02530 family flagellar biosynthesis protein [Spirochaetota bacterium]|nr:TIGR02530 family flagellar biosynthesis protein [Spirochaetota bacterium]
MAIQVVNHNTYNAKIKQNKQQPAAPENSFSGILKQKIQSRKDGSAKIKISNHAQQRIAKRNINIANKDINKLSNAVNLAKKKGSKETLVYYKNNAYLFNVKTSTLITAMDNNSMQGNVITNIDSTIFM